MLFKICTTSGSIPRGHKTWKPFGKRPVGVTERWGGLVINLISTDRLSHYGTRFVQFDSAVAKESRVQHSELATYYPVAKAQQGKAVGMCVPWL